MRARAECGAYQKAAFDVCDGNRLAAPIDDARCLALVETDHDQGTARGVRISIGTADHEGDRSSVGRQGERARAAIDGGVGLADVA